MSNLPIAYPDAHFSIWDMAIRAATTWAEADGHVRLIKWSPKYKWVVYKTTAEVNCQECRNDRFGDGGL